MCETTSPARLIRFIKAKLPTSPAATAVSNTSTTEYVSAIVTVGQRQVSGGIESLGINQPPVNVEVSGFG